MSNTESNKMIIEVRKVGPAKLVIGGIISKQR